MRTEVKFSEALSNLYTTIFFKNILEVVLFFLRIDTFEKVCNKKIGSRKIRTTLMGIANSSLACEPFFLFSAAVSRNIIEYCYSRGVTHSFTSCVKNSPSNSNIFVSH